jgi:hypothetical protein
VNKLIDNWLESVEVKVRFIVKIIYLTTEKAYTVFSADTKLNHETLVVRASCPLDIYLITPGSAVSQIQIDINCFRS